MTTLIVVISLGLALFFWYARKEALASRQVYMDRYHRLLRKQQEYDKLERESLMEDLDDNLRNQR